ncbi:MAG: ATP-binding cassette domain-containing protein [Gemmatimonadaceae bacterium]|nr:ATP-binding cassette domain-containing protein [Gemmatimonadaceae bacterium]
MTGGERSLIEARGLGIGFPGVRAVSRVDFDVRPGEVHALVGENGAGKSTLGKLLTGALQGDEGEIAVDGVVRRFPSPREALAAGIAVIPQELQLVTSLDVAENISLGMEERSANGLVDRERLKARARAQLDAVGAAHIAADTKVRELSPGDRQLVAIARALAWDARCLIMDEPTASLGAGEEARLEQVIRALVARGTGVVYVSHKLDEILRLADRVTVMRDGERVTTRAAAGLSAPELVRLMVGRDIAPAALPPVSPLARDVLRIEGLSVAPGEGGAAAGVATLHDISLRVRAGEVVGLAGLVGAGRTDLLLSLVGAHSGNVRGRIWLDGKEYQPRTPTTARDAGLVLLPEERKSDGIFPQLGVDRNITMSALERVSRWGWIDREGDARESSTLMRRTGVRAASPHVAMGTLSGGNQQKALLARCLFSSPKVLLLDEPTRGIDLAARADVYRELHALAAEGFGILIASSDMSEVLTQCHRILVFRHGRIVAEFEGDEATEEKVLAAAAGTSSEDGGAPTAGGGADSSGTHSSGTPSSGTRRPPATPPASPAARAIARYRGALGLVAVILLSIVFSPTRGGLPVFLDLGNLTDILRQVAEKGILAVGMTAVVIAGGIDLSVGSILAFGATLSAWLLMKQDVGLLPTAIAVVGAGALWGWLNGVVVARWKLPAFIATLATMSAARGAARYLSGGTAIPLGFGDGGAPESVRALAAPLLHYVPAPALVFGLAVVLMHLYLARTRGGRYLYAIGDNESAARLSGVRVGWHTATVYVISGALAALAGLVHCAQLEQGNPNDGVAYELDAIAAVVIGGTSLSGGTGSVAGTLIGILTIGVINNSMGLNNVDANLQLILKGVIILAAVWLQRRRSS